MVFKVFALFLEKRGMAGARGLAGSKEFGREQASGGGVLLVWLIDLSDSLW